MDKEPEISPTIAALLDIMTDPGVSVGESIHAAKALVEYEAASQVFDLAHKFLLGVATAEEQPVRLKLAALELLRKVQDRRVQPGSTTLLGNNRRLGMDLARARRRVELMRKGEWPPKGQGWMEGLEPLAVGPIEAAGLADRLKAARLRKQQ